MPGPWCLGPGAWDGPNAPTHINPPVLCQGWCNGQENRNAGHLALLPWVRCSVDLTLEKTCTASSGRAEYRGERDMGYCQHIDCTVWRWDLPSKVLMSAAATTSPLHACSMPAVAHTLVHETPGVDVGRAGKLLGPQLPSFDKVRAAWRGRYGAVHAAPACAPVRGNRGPEQPCSHSTASGLPAWLAPTATATLRPYAWQQCTVHFNNTTFR